MTYSLSATQLSITLNVVATEMISLRDMLNTLDAAMGDGDTGISVSKAGVALQDYVVATPAEGDLGKYLANAGMAINRAASSTMGTLIATGFMRMGKEAKGASAIDLDLLVKMATAFDTGIQERGKAKPGDKTIVDALHPAAETFAQAVACGADVVVAGHAALDAARVGRDVSLGWRSKIGRASWVGERTEGKPDPGMVLCVHIIETLLGEPHSVHTFMANLPKV